MTGKYRHAMDGKGRLAVPAKLREDLGAVFYLTIGFQHSLMLLPLSAWEALEKQKRELPLAEAQNLRFLFANAQRCETDKQGRIIIPADLRKYAAITENAVIIGVGDRAEIWDAGVYDAMEAAFLASDGMDRAFLALGI